MKPSLRQLLLAGRWTPARLFANGEQGAWYDPSDLSTQFQDSSGTTAAALSLPVGLISDKSGRGNHASQATAPSRPTLVQPTYYSLRADGVDDSLAATTGGGGTTGILICAAITVQGAATTRTLWNDRTVNNGYVFQVNAADKLALLAGNGVSLTGIVSVASLPAGETHVITAWDDGANLNVQIDNGAVASVARPVVVAGTAGFTLFKQNDSPSQFFNGDCQQLVYVKDTAKSAAERTALKRFVGNKVGIAL